MAKAKTQKPSKTTNAATIGMKLDRPAGDRNAILVKEFATLVGGLCSTRMDVAFIAAEMLLHVGRGQMAAQLGHHYSHEDNAALNALRTDANIFEYPEKPHQESVVEALFLGFMKSVANNDPALKKHEWKTAGNSDLPFIAALSFLVGNLAWQQRSGTGPMSRADVKAAFDQVAGKHCPVGAPLAGGGPWCDWMDL